MNEPTFRQRAFKIPTARQQLARAGPRHGGSRLWIDELVLGLLALVVRGYAASFLIDEGTRVEGATLLGGLVVAAGTYRTIQVTSEGQIPDRFPNAIGQLGDEVAEVRL